MRSPTINSIPSGSARAARTSIVCGKHESATKNCGDPARALDSPCLHAVQQRHRLGRRSRFVEQRGVRDLHAGQIAHHGLEVEERFEAALRDFRLVGRIRRVPAGVLENVADDDARRDAVVVAETEEGSKDLVTRRRLPQLAEELVLALAVGQVQRLREPDAARNGFVDRAPPARPRRRPSTSPRAGRRRARYGGPGSGRGRTWSGWRAKG